MLTFPARGTPRPAQRLDLAIGALIAGRRPVVEPALAGLLETAAAIRAALPLIPPSARFEERLGRRLAGAREQGTARRLLVSGAVGSAVSLAGVTVYALWRAGHRHA